MNKRLLVLDDDPGVLESYRAILEVQAIPQIRSSRGGAAAAVAAAPQAQPDFELTLARSGEQALKIIEEAVKQNKPFVGGFFDVKLGPGMDGIETIRRAIQIDPGLLCIVVTAYQDRSVEEISRVFGEDYSDRWDFIAKPFTRFEILQKAKNLIYHWDRRAREKEYLERIKTQQTMLVQQERLAAVGTLARGIGHEFGNILTKIIGRAQLAAQATKLTEAKEALNLIAQAAERAGVIVGNLRGMSKLEAKREKIDIKLAIQDAINLMKHEFYKHSITLKEDYGANAEFEMNRVEMGQVFLNLFINAVHAMKDKEGTIEVKTWKEGKTLRVSVSDTGSGIPPEVLPKIFEPLFTTKGEEGTGIGLSVTDKIVQSHNGAIAVKSTVGVGTTFTVVFPIA